MTIIDRFNAKWRLSETGCWEWIAAKYYNGYGVFHIAGQNHTAHRAAWLLLKGEIPEGMTDVCHKCDNKGCVNPDHLFLGTRSDNMMDRVNKGKHPRTPNKGTKNGRALICEDDVRAIRADPRSHVEVAREFGMTANNVSYIRSRKIWKHVE